MGTTPTEIRSGDIVYYCNAAIALKRLKTQGRIESAFLIDFDAHTGDGTIDCLKDWKEVKVLDPMAEDSQSYQNTIDEYISSLDKVDVIAVCAGFDSYKLDIGGKLSTFDYYVTGRKMRLLSKKIANSKRFAMLEGGYDLPDLGKNVAAFCDGFKENSNG